MNFDSYQHKLIRDIMVDVFMTLPLSKMSFNNYEQKHKRNSAKLHEENVHGLNKQVMDILKHRVGLMLKLNI